MEKVPTCMVKSVTTADCCARRSSSSLNLQSLNPLSALGLPSAIIWFFLILLHLIFGPFHHAVSPCAAFRLSRRCTAWALAVPISSSRRPTQQRAMSALSLMWRDDTLPPSSRSTLHAFLTTLTLCVEHGRVKRGSTLIRVQSREAEPARCKDKTRQGRQRQGRQRRTRQTEPCTAKEDDKAPRR